MHASPRRAICRAVGDSDIWIARGRKWQPLFPVKNQGRLIASSAVDTVPGNRKPPTVVKASLEPGDLFVLMSDGVGDPLGDGEGDVGEFLADAWRRPPAPLEFAAQVQFRRRTFTDDRTVVALWIPSEA